MLHAADPEMVTAEPNAGSRARSGNKRVMPQPCLGHLKSGPMAGMPALRAGGAAKAGKMYKLRRDNEMLFNLLFKWNLR